MKDGYTTNSPYLTYTYLFKRSGECILIENLGVKGLTLSRVINFKFPLQPHQEMTSHSMKNLNFHSLLGLRGLYYQFSLPRVYISLQKVGRMYLICEDGFQCAVFRTLIERCIDRGKFFIFVCLVLHEVEEKNKFDKSKKTINISDLRPAQSTTSRRSCRVLRLGKYHRLHRELQFWCLISSTMR